MDISFKAGNQKFNYRVCAMMISDGKILAMHDERSPYYYLPGGRVAIGETAESAVIREVWEELGVTPKIVRPLWLNQAFFTEDVDNLHYHELCIYFLMDITDTDLLSRGKSFTDTGTDARVLDNANEHCFIPHFCCLVRSKFGSLLSSNKNNLV